MLNKQETQLILEGFFGECKNFWIRNGKDERKAYELAIKDIESANYNPYEPFDSKLLDKETKKQFIIYMRMNL